jgi:hypothetical protein
VQEPEYWNVIDPAGNIVASETDAIRGWARIAGSYKPTVEGLLGFHDQGWRVLPKPAPPAQPAPVFSFQMQLKPGWGNQYPKAMAIGQPDIESLFGKIGDIVTFYATPPEAQPAPVRPVAWLVEFENGEQELHFDEQSVGETNTPLYTTPPAAQQQGPYSAPVKEMWPAVPDAIGPNEDELPAYAAGWNDCRAEMLRGKP